MANHPNSCPEVLLITREVQVRDAVESAAAALGLEPTLAPDADTVRGDWAKAGTVLVGQDRLEQVARLGLMPRDRVFLVGPDAAALAAWSAPLNAVVVHLGPQGAGLAQILNASGSATSGSVVAVVGGSGGVGTSTLAAGLAYRAGASGLSVALVDLDVLGGGIDLLVGAESISGWRWPRLARAEGQLGDVAALLPDVDGLCLLAMGRGEGTEILPAAVSAVISALARDRDLVVVDAARGAGPLAAAALRKASRVFLLAGSDVRSVASAREVATNLDSGEVVVRTSRAAPMPPDLVAETIGLPLAGVVVEDAAVRLAAEQGVPPGMSRRRGWGRSCAALADRLVA